MNVYVIGAGVSMSAGYPLGWELFDKVDQFDRYMGAWTHRFDFGAEWPKLNDWLSNTSNPLIAESYRARKLEHLFTVLDLASMLSTENLGAIARGIHGHPGARAKAAKDYEAFAETIEKHRWYRNILLFALERYFDYLHNRDKGEWTAGAWQQLEAFGDKLRTNDLVVTFNYDSTLERVLLQRGKWSPKNGYGFELVFQATEGDDTKVEFTDSAVTVLHLHGSVGWYGKPWHRAGYVPATGGGGSVGREEFGPTPLETPVALDPIFLHGLGINAVDAMLPRRPPQEDQILLHPSFLKDYEQEGSLNNVFTKLWRTAAKALREAERVFVIGYSLPPADSAAVTLLVTNCERAKVRVINPSVPDSHRLRALLSTEVPLDPVSFEEWLSDESNP